MQKRPSTNHRRRVRHVSTDRCHDPVLSGAAWASPKTKAGATAVRVCFWGPGLHRNSCPGPLGKCAVASELASSTSGMARVLTFDGHGWVGGCCHHAQWCVYVYACVCVLVSSFPLHSVMDFFFFFLNLFSHSLSKYVLLHLEKPGR